MDAGDGVIVEKPTYLAAIQVFSIHQPNFYSIALTGEGLDVAQLKDVLDHAADPIKFLYLIPNFQNPTGLTYSRENRVQIYELLKDQDVVLIEDDPYGELRFEGEPLSYIGAGRLANSVLLGSFSKTVTPRMRTGFMISENTELLRYFTMAKESSDLHTNIFSQYLIWDHLTNNSFEEHIAKIRELYQKQAQAMMDVIAQYFPDNIQYTKPKGGIFNFRSFSVGLHCVKKRLTAPKISFDHKQVETICTNFLRSLDATKLSIAGHLYFVL